MTRKKEEVRKRWEKICELHEVGLTTMAIAREVGLDHSSVFHALQKMGLKPKAVLKQKTKMSSWIQKSKKGNYRNIAARQVSIPRDMRGNPTGKPQPNPARISFFKFE